MQRLSFYLPLFWKLSRGSRHRLYFLGLLLALNLLLWSVTRGVSLGFMSSLKGVSRGIDMIVGGVSTPLHLVGLTYLLLGEPTQNVPMDLVQELRGHEDFAWVSTMSFGDSWGRFRVAGVDDEFFLQVMGLPVRLERDFTAMVGFQAARLGGLGKGQTIQLAHGLDGVDFQESDSHSRAFQVVEVLPPTGGPWDYLIFVRERDFHSIHDGGQSGSSVVLLKLRKRIHLFDWQRKLQNRGFTVALPGLVFQSLMERWKVVTWVMTAFQLLLGIVSLFSSFFLFRLLIDSKSHDLGLMRALGVSQWVLWGYLMFEIFFVTLVAWFVTVGGVTLIQYLLLPWLTREWGLWIPFLPGLWFFREIVLLGFIVLGGYGFWLLTRLSTLGLIKQREV